MIIMPVPKDVRKIKAKFIGPFTKRQTLAVVPAGLIGIFLFILLRELLPMDVCAVVIGVIDAPILLCGFIDIYGMPFWVYAKEVAMNKLLYPKKRPYATENTYEGLAVQNKITYEYFDGDLVEYTEKEHKKKKKLNRKRLEAFLKEHPDLIEIS